MRLARTLHKSGILTQVDRTTLAAYYRLRGRLVEPENKLAETPALLRTPADCVQPSR
jgi:hypothetical protein